MNSITTIIIAVLSSGLIAAIVSAFMQKRNEKEQRIFNAKLEAYKDFAAHLESSFVTILKSGGKLDFPTLAEISAKCLLVSNRDLNDKLKSFINFSSELYEKCCHDKEKDSEFDKLRKDRDEIENLMREDLGFK